MNLYGRTVYFTIFKYVNMIKKNHKRTEMFTVLLYMFIVLMFLYLGSDF